MGGCGRGASGCRRTICPALQKSLQQEWQFVQRVVKDIGDAFTDVEKVSQSFLPALFGDDFDEDDPRLV
jgi:hypothetical protein